MTPIARSKMPQLHAGEFAALADFAEQRRVEIVPATAIYLNASDQSPDHWKPELFKWSDLERPILASRDGYILDGHHRYRAWKHRFGKASMVPFFYINLPIAAALALLRSFERHRSP